MSPWSHLVTWMGRASPRPSALARAIGSAAAAYGAGIALFVGAPYLLVESAGTSHVVTAGRLAVLLVIIELLAFARSPARYAERLHAHDLGLSSVTQWRRWLLVTIGTWPFRRWRAASNGDLLERALHDTDELQDLLLRCVVPASAASLATVIAIAVLSAWPAGTVRLGWACAALVADLAIGALLTSLFLGPLVAAERRVRVARTGRTSSLVDAQSFAAEAALLDRSCFLQRRLDAATTVVTDAERRRDSLARALHLTALGVPVGGVVFVSWIANVGPGSFGRTGLVVVLMGAVVFETLAVLRSTVEVAARVVIATERLDDLLTPAASATRPWPERATVRARSLVVRLGDRDVLRDVDLDLAPGSRVAVTGPVGSGKSTLLRLLAGLDDPDAGVVRANDVALAEIADDTLRHHVGYVSAAPRLTNGIASRVLRAGREIDVDVAVTMAGFAMDADDTTRWTALSRGEAMRVAIARQLLSSPDILFLDEPTSGLGPAERAAVLQRLRQFSGTIVCATHDRELVAACAHELSLRDGAWVNAEPSL